MSKSRKSFKALCFSKRFAIHSQRDSSTISMVFGSFIFSNVTHNEALRAIKQCNVGLEADLRRRRGGLDAPDTVHRPPAAQTGRWILSQPQRISTCHPKMHGLTLLEWSRGTGPLWVEKVYHILFHIGVAHQYRSHRAWYPDAVVGV